MPTVKLTVAFVERAVVEPGKATTIYWDLPRFGLRVNDTGHKSYVIQYRSGARGRAGTDRIPTIGRAGHHSIALDLARTEARKLFVQIAAGRDPLSEQRAAVAHAANTLQAVVENYFAVECGMERDVNGRAIFPQSDDGKTKLRSARQRLQTFERLVYPSLGTIRSPTSSAATS